MDSGSATPRQRHSGSEATFLRDRSNRSSMVSIAASAHLSGVDPFLSPLPSGWFENAEQYEPRTPRRVRGRGIDNFRAASTLIPSYHRSLDPLDAVRLQRAVGDEDRPARSRPDTLHVENGARARLSPSPGPDPQRRRSSRHRSRSRRHVPDAEVPPLPELSSVEAHISTAMRNAHHPQTSQNANDVYLNGNSWKRSRRGDSSRRSEIDSTLVAQSMMGVDAMSLEPTPPLPPAKDYHDGGTQVYTYHSRPRSRLYQDMGMQTSPVSSQSSLNLKALPSVRSQSSSTDEKANILPAKEPEPADDSGMPKGPRFWALMISLMSVTMLAALGGTIVSTALPTIVGDLNGGAVYLWAANAYFLANAAIAPFYAQMADIFGRRSVMVTAVSLFIIGCGISGGTYNMNMLIGGRTVQGIGAGGLQMMVNLVISDIIPPRQRPQYLALSFGATAVATGLGPVFSGLIVSNTTWRWVFWLNLPFGGLALVLLGFFLNTNHEKKSAVDKFKSIDYVGHILFVPSVSAILIAFTYAGPVHPWTSWNTLVPLIVGFVGLIAFIGWEASGIPIKPNIPVRVLANRTSAVVFAIGFLHSLLNIWANYFLPVYFQAVQLSSPERSGVQLLPDILPFMVTAMAGGKVLQIVGRYRELQLVSIGLMVVSFGLFTLLSADSSTAYWVLVQILNGAAAGFAAGTLLPAAQAPLDQKDIAAIVGTFSFAKAFGMSWGVTLPATIFNNKFDDLAFRITDDKVRAIFSNGAAYSRATADVISALPDPIRAQVIGVYTDTLKFMWQIATGVCGLTFLLIFLEKHYELRTTMKSAYDMKNDKKKEKGPGKA